MPVQTPSLNIKANDQGWQGTQIQLYTCAECGTQSSNASQHSSWHDGITNSLNALQTALQQEVTARAQAVQAEQTRAVGVEANLQAQINTKT